MTWLLTNDDGVIAPGLSALARSLSPEQSVLIAAPQVPHSGCGHQVTTTTPLQIELRQDLAFENSQGQALNHVAVFGIGGTPADCVRVARFHLKSALSWVLSGVNAGSNLGADCYISGTVAAVREAALHGIPGIALSQYRQGDRPIDWSLASLYTRRVIEALLPLPLKEGCFWNVNFPHLGAADPEPEIVFCEPSQRPLPVSFRAEGNLLYYEGNYSQRDREPGSDVEVCLGGHIAVTQLRL
ncbi:5'/3'-nucleotidase SurE [Altericista sp. CCNU0014]|uniref:5'/3'-nucleotidase SurE n=1 Tax=Altericista sp. CCNU0014 TaxID=3082949 RepID=UPI00384B93BB